MTNRLATAVPFLIATALSAQADRPTFLAKQPLLAEIRADDVPALLAKLPSTALGRLLADPEVAAACALGTQRLARHRQQAQELLTAAVALDLEPLPILPVHLLGEVGVVDLRSVVFAIPLAESDRSRATFLTMIGCTPRAEGRLVRVYENHVAQLAQSPKWRRLDEVRVDGMPADGFGPAKAEDQTAGAFASLRHEAAWMAHLPGTFLFGSGTPDDCGAMGNLGDTPPAGVSLAMFFKPYLTMFGRLGGGVPADFAALGFDTLASLQWRLSFADGLLLDECIVELDGAPGGLVGALLNGTAKLPAQALPAGALAQLRCAVGLRELLAAADKLGVNLPLTGADQKDLLAAFTGGLALGVTAPAKGGLIPRLFLSLGLADPAAFARLLTRLLPANTPRKLVTYEGVECTVLTLADLPPALQPTYCIRDGVLHVAESPISMRAFLKVQQPGVEAMAIDDLQVPAGPGELQPTFDVRYDATALYTAFYDLWLPLWELQANATNPAATSQRLARDELPEAATVAPMLGKGRGVLRRAGKRFVLQQHGTLGGLETAAFAMTYGPIVAAQMDDDWVTANRAQEVSLRKLELVWEKVSAYKAAHGDWPASLGALFADRRIPEDALLLPGCELAEPVVLADGDSRTIRSSFRYFPKPVPLLEMEVGAVHSALLVEIAPRPRGRTILADDGTATAMQGERSMRAIEQFER